MISYNVYKEYAAGKHYVEGFCLSTDVKPVENMANGSSLIEMDTSKVFLFDEAGSQWDKFGA